MGNVIRRFQRIETLPGLPEEETARKILETLADDPGIRAVLEKHRWTVGALCELYPEGKVNVVARLAIKTAIFFTMHALAGDD